MFKDAELYGKTQHKVSEFKCKSVVQYIRENISVTIAFSAYN